MKIERIEINAMKNKFSYTFIRHFNGRNSKYKVWIYNGHSKTGKTFSISRNAFFKNVVQLQKEKALTYYTICTENGFGMVYPITNIVKYTKYGF